MFFLLNEVSANTPSSYEYRRRYICQQFGMRIDRCVNGELHCVYRPRVIPAIAIAHADGEFILVRQLAGQLFTAWQRHHNLATAPRGYSNRCFQPQSLIAATPRRPNRPLANGNSRTSLPH